MIFLKGGRSDGPYTAINRIMGESTSLAKRVVGHLKPKFVRAPSGHQDTFNHIPIMKPGCENQVSQIGGLNFAGILK